MFNIIKKDFALKISLYFLIAVIIIFTAARAAIYLAYPLVFTELAACDVFKAFFFGLRFDFSITALIIGPGIFLLNLPFNSKKYIKAWALVFILVILLLIPYFIADFIYFERVHRHIAGEILQIRNDWGYIINYAFKDYWFVFPALFAAAAGLCILFFKHINKNYTFYASPKYTALKLLLIAAFVIIGIRGKIDGKSLSIADAFLYSKNADAASLTLNGVFTGYHILRKGKMEIKNNYPEDLAIKNMQKALIGKNELLTAPDYPLMRRIKDSDFKDKNVLIVLLESWTPKYIDSLSGGNFGVTPVFDGIVAGGASFTNAYAVGIRSVAAFSAVAASVPMLPSLPVFGEGLEMAEATRVFKDFADKGFYTFFAQSSYSHSFRLCSLSAYLGAKECFGMEHMPNRMSYLEKADFGYDYDLLMFAADKIQSLKGQRFFGMLFTGSTHEPFPKTDERFEIYERNSWEGGYLNSMAYADWSIGQMLERAKEDGWFKDTVFIFAADHITRKEKSGGAIYNNFHIPIVIYAPGIVKPAEYDYTVSQLDILPTIYNMASLNTAYTGFGRNLFDNSAERFAIVSQGNTMGIITDKGAIEHSGEKILSAEAKAKDFDSKQAEETLLSAHKAATALLKNNKWFDDDAK